MFLRTIAKANSNLHRTVSFHCSGVPCYVQRSLGPKMIPQLLKSGKFASQEKEYLTIASMTEQISPNSKTVQERREEFSGSTRVHMYRQ